MVCCNAGFSPKYLLAVAWVISTCEGSLMTLTSPSINGKLKMSRKLGSTIAILSLKTASPC